MSKETFTIKDGGDRMKFEGGMVRDTAADKVRFDLVFDGPMFKRLAEHLTKGAQKYEARNWMKARGTAEAERFKQSAVRHFIQWLDGDRDEDHAAAVFFNINGYEFVMEKMRRDPEDGMIGRNDGTGELIWGTPCSNS